MAVDLSRLKVLIVDDNAYMLTILRTLLHGFSIKTVYESRDPADAFDIVRSDTVDIIITDYQMDILDGLDFVRLVRTGDDSPNPLIPIVMVSAYSERSRVQKARDAGVTEFCCKPITARDMFAKLAAIVNAPRAFIRNKSYFGPDRRRQEAGRTKYQGQERRAGAIAAAAAAAAATSAEGEPDPKSVDAA
jgi:two-component system chemotaxis response regulator CheY